jgi:hypothetical protein
MADIGYEFRVVETPTGEKRYLYTNTDTGKETELSDQAAYDRLKAKFGAVTNQAYEEAGADPEMDDYAKSAKARLRPIGRATGGKISLNDCKVSTHQKSKKSPNW